MQDHDDHLRAESAELEHLLGDIEASVTPQAWERIECAITRIVRLYGFGLAHVLEHARTAGATPAFEEMVVGDDVLASLLVVHGLHPLPVEERVRRALVDVRAELGFDDGDLVLVGVRNGRAELCAVDRFDERMTCVVETAIRRVVANVAPELAGVDIRSSAALA